MRLYVPPFEIMPCDEDEELLRKTLLDGAAKEVVRDAFLRGYADTLAAYLHRHRASDWLRARRAQQ